MENFNTNSALIFVGFMSIGGSLGVAIAENHCDSRSGAIKEKCLEYYTAPYMMSGMLMGASLGLIADYMLNNVEFQ